MPRLMLNDELWSKLEKILVQQATDESLST